MRNSSAVLRNSATGDAGHVRASRAGLFACLAFSLAVVSTAAAGAGGRSAAKRSASRRPAPLRVSPAFLKESPNIDGRLVEACWREATPLGDFLNIADGKVAEPKTRVLVAQRGRWLYVAAACETEDIRRLVALRTRRDSDVFNDDSFEVLLDPVEPSGRVFRFVINSLGTRMDEVIPFDGRGVGESRPFWLGRARQGKFPAEQRWTAEIAVDLASLGLGPKNKGRWRVNFIRHTRGYTRSDSAWSPPRIWRFGCDKARMGVLGPVDLRAVGYGCRLRVASAEARLSETALRGRIAVEVENTASRQRAFDIVLRTTTRWMDRRRVVVGSGERASVGFDFEMALGEEPELKIEAADPDLGIPLAATAYVLKPPPPLKTRFDRSYYTAEASATFLAEIGLSPSAERSLEMRLFNAGDGKMVWHRSVPSLKSRKGAIRSRVAAVVPVARLPVGGYLMETVLSDQVGGLRYRVWSAMRRLAARRGEIKVDWGGGFLRRDGKPFYLVEVRRVDRPRDLVFDDLQSRTAFNVNWGWRIYYKNPENYVRRVYEATGCLADMNVDQLYWAKREQRDLYIENVRRLAALPCMFGYHMEHLPGEEGFSTEPVATVRTYLQSLDPHHPFYVILGDSHQAARYRDCADFLAVRCRAVAPGGVSQVEWVYEQMRRARSSAGRGVPIVAMFPAYRDLEKGIERPTAEQMRAMTYLAFAAGAAGVIFDGYHYRTSDDPLKRGFSNEPRLREMIYILSRHAAFLGPILAAPEDRSAVRVVQPPLGSVRWTARRWGGVVYLLAVNASAQKAYAAFEPGDGGAFGGVREIFENRAIGLDGSRFSMEFGPYETHVFAITETR